MIPIPPSIPSVPSVPSLQDKIKIPSVGKKLSVKPVKINVKTGSGVPGGFDAGSIKLPTTAIKKVFAGIAAVGAMAAKVSSILAKIAAGENTTNTRNRSCNC